MDGKLNDLRKENDELINENRQLKEKLRMYETAKSPVITSKKEKLALFQSFFYGRQDVVAHRYYSKTTARYGYSPLCANEFQKGKCPKCERARFHCITCPNRFFLPMSDELLLKHFTGDVKQGSEYCLGIYPLLKDGTCRILAIDFDDKRWFEDMISVYQTAFRLGVHSLLERSLSGHGGHLWIFFAEPVKANQARKLGDMILKETMKQNASINLSSFDRMFPNQDYTAEEGFGNLIALPLQSGAYKKGNSSFIDEDGKPIENPIGFLSTMHKLTLNEVDRLIQLDESMDYFFDADQLSIMCYSDTKYDRKLSVIEENMLYIDKKNLNALSVSMIRRVSSMYNPEYFLMQRLHKPIYKLSRLICEYKEDDHYIAIPSGCLERLHKAFLGADVQVEDRRISGNSIDVEFVGALTKQQEEAVKTLLNYETGVLQASAGFGKTVMALYLIAKRQCNTLVIVNTKKLLDQWLEQIDKFLKYPQRTKKKDYYIGVYTGNKKNLKYNLDVATIAALSRNENIAQQFENLGRKRRILHY